MEAARQSARKYGLSPQRAVVLYFVVTFAISWSAALALAAPRLLRGEAIPKFTGLMMFPLMLLGPLVAGVGLTWLLDGVAGVRSLVARMLRWRTGAGWYLALLVPPVFMLAALGGMRLLGGAVYGPNLFVVGAGFGVVAGWVEEPGWTGFALHRLLPTGDGLRKAMAVGAIWSLWHLPVVDFLGAATPHGRWLLPYWLAFAAVMVAVRVLIAWVYAHTRSVLLAQMVHASSTGALVVFSPAHVTAAEECLWYVAYAALMWLAIALVWNRLRFASLGDGGCGVQLADGLIKADPLRE